eukprot:3002472-Pleurochrysis_carterae.AAC.1
MSGVGGVLLRPAVLLDWITTAQSTGCLGTTSGINVQRPCNGKSRAMPKAPVGRRKLKLHSLRLGKGSEPIAPGDTSLAFRKNLPL